MRRHAVPAAAILILAGAGLFRRGAEEGRVPQGRPRPESPAARVDPEPPTPESTSGVEEPPAPDATDRELRELFDRYVKAVGEGNRALEEELYARLRDHRELALQWAEQALSSAITVQDQEAFFVTVHAFRR